MQTTLGTGQRLPLARILAALVLVVLIARPSTRAEGIRSLRPMNIVLILVDDLGWTDVGCFGSPTYQTPHVDLLAKGGVRFTDAYAPACSCSPSRAGIMTGKYPGRLGMTAIIEKHRGDRAPDDAPLLPATTKPFLPNEEVTIAEVLKSQGYSTCLVGKWHLGDQTHEPRQHGFDVAVGPPHAGAPRSYFWPQWNGNPRLPGRFPGEYLTDRLAEEACQFIEDHQRDPFFLCLSFHTVHVPIEAKQDKVAKYEALLRSRGKEETRHTNAHYAAMVESMDEAVGCVLETLERLHLQEDSLVIFFSDNGGLVHRSHRGEHTPATSNAPLRSGKGFLYEGGIRVPLIIRWPGVAMSGGVCQAPVHGCDLFPTICEAAGIRLDSLSYHRQLDGQSLQSLLRNPDQQTRPRTLFWHYPHFSTMGGRPSAAVRRGNWKLVEHFETGSRELYDLQHDIGESEDLSKTHPEKAAQLHETLADWRARMKALLPSRENPNYQGHERSVEGT
jgi:arylsulfatase A-like enzyme